MSEPAASEHVCGARRPEDAPAGALGATNWLSYAATPCFALMALLTASHEPGPTDALCSGASAPLAGMVPMYVLMSVFHAVPWMTLMFGRRRR